MNREEIAKWIEKEKSTVLRDFTDITFGIDNIIDFKEGTDISNRYFIKNIKILDKYSEKISEIEGMIGKTKKVLFFTVDDIDKEKVNMLIDECNGYKNQYKDVFEKMSFCRECKCLSCINDCKFSSCNTCFKRGKVTECDKKEHEIVMFNNTKTELYNSETMVYDTVNVLTQVNILSKNNLYRVIEANGDYLILTYSKEINGKETYGEVKDMEAFDYVSEAYERNIENII